MSLEEDTFLDTYPIGEFGWFVQMKQPPFQLHDKVMFYCPSDYATTTLFSRVIRTRDGLAWDPSKMSCGLRDLPSPIPHGRCISKQGPPYYEGHKAIIQCQQGYFPREQDIQVIQKEGELIWNIPPIPCQSVTLSTPPEVVNGTLTISSSAPYLINTLATVQCPAEHKAFPPISRLTLNLFTNQLEWDPPQLECNRNMCPEPPATPIQGERLGTSRKIIDKITYQCPPNHVLFGKWRGKWDGVENPYVIQCLVSGVWNPEAPEEFQCRFFENQVPKSNTHFIGLFSILMGIYFILIFILRIKVSQSIHKTKDV